MFKKQPVLEPIKLKLKLPENGTYPPRIVMPGETLWLRGDSVKAGKLTFVRGLHNNWKLLAHDKHKILVNGQAIVLIPYHPMAIISVRERGKAFFRLTPLPIIAKPYRRKKLMM